MNRKTVSVIILMLILTSTLTSVLYIQPSSSAPDDTLLDMANLTVSFIEVGQDDVLSPKSPEIRLSVADHYGYFVSGVIITVANPSHLPSTYYEWSVTERTSDYVVKANDFPFFAIRDDFLFTFEKSGFNTKSVSRELAINAPFIDFIDENGVYTSDSSLQFNMEALPSHVMVYNSFQAVFVDSTKYHVAMAYQSDYSSDWLNSYVVLSTNYFMVTNSETCNRSQFTSTFGPGFSQAFPTETLDELADLANQMIYCASHAFFSKEIRDVAAQLLGMAVAAYLGSVSGQISNVHAQALIQAIKNNYKGIDQAWKAFMIAQDYLQVGVVATESYLLSKAFDQLGLAGNEFLTLKTTMDSYRGTTRYQYSEVNGMFETWFHASSTMLAAADFIESIMPYEEWWEQLDDVLLNALEGATGIPFETWLASPLKILKALCDSYMKYAAIRDEFYGRRWQEESASAELRQKIQNTGQTQIAIPIPSANDFIVSAYYVSTQTTSATVFAGFSVTFTVDVELVSGSVSAVSLSLSGHDETMSVSFTPQTAIPSFSSSLAISTSVSTSGRFVLTVHGSSGDIARSSQIALEVLNPPPVGSAITIAPLNSATGTVLYGAYTRYHGAVDPYYNGREVWLAQSIDGGQTWYSVGQYIPTSDNKWYYPSSMTVVPIWLSAWLGVDHPCIYLMKAGIHGTVLESNIISFTIVKAPTSAEISVTPDIIVEEETLTVTGVISSNLGISGGGPYTCEGTWYVDWRQESGSWNVLASGTVSAQYEIPPDGGPYSILFNIPTQTWTPPNSGDFEFRLRYSGDNKYEASTSDEKTVSVEADTHPITVSVNGLPSSNATEVLIDNAPIDILMGGTSETYEVSRQSFYVSVNSTISFGSNARHVSSPMWQMVSGPGYYNFTYNKQFELSVEVSPTETGTVMLTGSTWYDSDIIVEARAISDINFTLDYWSIDNVYAGSAENLSMIMDGSHTLKAYFIITGDVNRDNIVDIFDIGYISAHWYPGPPIGPLGYDTEADINRDGAVDISDVGLTSANWGETW